MRQLLRGARRPRERQGLRRAQTYDGNEYLDFFGGILTVSVGHANEKVNAARARADGAPRPRVDAVPDAADRRARREARVARAGQAQEGVLLRERHRGRRDRRRARADRTRGGRSSSRCATATRAARCSRSRSTAHAKYRVIPTQVAAIKHAHAPYCYRCPFGLKYPSCEVAVRARTSRSSSRRRPRARSPASSPSRSWASAASSRRPTATSRSRSTSSGSTAASSSADEVQTGFGRTGDKMWGIEHHDGVEPDIMTMAKGIANGYPSAPTLATTAIADAWKGGNISTFGGNPHLVRPRPTRRSTSSSTRSSPRTRRRWARCCARGSRRCRRSTRASSATCAARGSCRRSSS